MADGTIFTLAHLIDVLVAAFAPAKLALAIARIFALLSKLALKS